MLKIPATIACLIQPNPNFHRLGYIIVVVAHTYVLLLDPKSFVLWFLKSFPMDICCTAHVTWPLKLHGPFFSLLSAMSVYVIADFASVLFERCVFLKETALNYLIVQCQYIQKWEKTLKERLISFHPHLSDVTWRNHCTEINSQNFISVCKEKQQMVLVEVCWSNQQPKLKFVLIQTDKHYGWITRDVIS